MNWTRYKIIILLCAAVVAWGVSYSIGEFNCRVRPQTPLQAFSLQSCGHSVYHVDFLGEGIDFTFPPEQVRQIAGLELIRKCHVQADVFLDLAGKSIQDFLLEIQVRFHKGKEWLQSRR